MKRFFGWVLTVAMLVSLCGCSVLFPEREPTDQHTFPPMNSDPTDPTGPTQGPGNDIWIQVPLTAISLPVTEEHIKADDGTVIFTQRFQNVVLSAENAAVAEKVNMDLLNRIDGSAASLHGLMDAARNSYATDPKNFSTFFFEVLYTPTRTDASVLSLYGTESSYAGAGIPSVASTAVNYNLLTGSMLILSDVLSKKQGVDNALCRALINTLSAQKEESQLFDDYADVISRRFQSDLQQGNTWYFTHEGLTFFFQPYDIAPHTAGTIHATIPYSQLTGILDDNYFPAEKPGTDAKLDAQWFDDADLDDYDLFTEVIMDPRGEMFLLTADNVVLDLSLEQGRWDSSTNQFVPTACVYAANCLTPNDAVVIQSVLSQTTPNLRLTYTVHGEIHRAFILYDILRGRILFQPC